MEPITMGTGVTAVLGTAFTLGLRHGADWDHIAALLDISGMPASRRRSMFLCLMYALGHAVVLLALGSVAILFGRFIPVGFETVMGRVVGLTLIALGIYLLVALIRSPDDFRPKGRVALITDALDRWRRRGRYQVVEVEHDHPHDHSTESHSHGHLSGTHDSIAPRAAIELRGTGTDTSPEDSRSVVAVAHRHSHRHTHRQVVPSPDAYGTKGALTIGMLHGVGAETPTQVLLMVTAAGLGGRSIALAVLVTFVAGLLITNTVIAAMATYGVLRDRSSLLFKIVGMAAAVFSLAYGTTLLIR